MLNLFYYFALKLLLLCYFRVRIQNDLQAEEDLREDVGVPHAYAGSRVDPVQATEACPH